MDLMIKVYGRQIIKFLAESQTLPVKSAFVAKSLQVSKDNLADFNAAVDMLASEGKIILGGGGQIALPAMSTKVEGIFRANERGFGFVVPIDTNAHGDLFIAPGDSGDAMSGDTVIARSIKKGVRRGVMQYNGIVVKVLERGIKRIVGTAQKMGGQWIVQPDGKAYIGLVAVDDVGAKGVVEGDKVCVEIIKYPSGTNLPAGVITEVIGRAGLYDTEIKSIIMQHQLPGEFGDDCIDQARSAAAGFEVEGISGRDDISDDVVITIDPPDAKDFDDAISLVRNGDGNWVLGVHIADVSSFIEMDSPLDVEAKDRGNSIYLPGKVIPMLPEILSNGICSLQPKQKRFAKSAYITYDDDGNVLGRTFANSILCSRARLTYHQADEILKGKAEGHPGEVVAL
ncbi:MAG: RNB domain-containing ribonuclease, partial [Planctomycetes bacterium]|nr:RNB domain-containing ribonuclease [Planctomycetota bacterium]